MKKAVKKVLLLRFSAMGDVAMAAAALREFAPLQPKTHFTMVSRPLFAPFFEGIDNLSFIAADFNKTYKGLLGLWRLFHELRRQKPDVVVDVHDVLRTKILRFLFRLWGFQVKKLNKGRREKRRLTRRRHKQLKPLKSMIERYTDALAAAVDSGQSAMSRMFLQPSTFNFQLSTFNFQLKLGIAPFAKYKGKIYPLEKMEKVISYFAQKKNVEIYLFGGGEEEVNLLAEWASKYKGVTSLAGKMSLSEELTQLAAMDLVLSMDSANMHLASLAGTPVVSIWGATHSFAGFTGWRQSEANIIQLDLACRPCSVFGNKPCYRNDYACLNIPEEIIIEKITTLL